MNFSKWWQQDHQPMKADNKFTKFSSLLTPKNLVFNCYNSGYISLKEIRKVAKDLGELTDDNILQEMIEIADRDLDTVVSEEEFYNLLTKKVYWKNSEWFISPYFLEKSFFKGHIKLNKLRVFNKIVRIKFVKFNN